MRRDISLDKGEGFAKVIISSDCQSLVNRVTTKVEDQSSCGPIIHDIRKMARSFTTCASQHVWHSLNVPAHKLAKPSEFFLFVESGVVIFGMVSLRIFVMIFLVM